MSGAVDVLVVGLGPVGQTLALLLARAGVSVLAVDAAAGPHGAPRAAVLDEGALSVLDAAGVGGAVRSLGTPQSSVGFAGADGRVREIARLAVPLLGLHQPLLEDALLGALPPAVVRWGVPVTHFEQDAHEVRAHLGDGSCVRAPWLVGCDGARSTVRRSLDIAFTGRTDPAPWLVVDARVAAPLVRVPFVTFVGDPRRPAVSLPLSPGWHRFEWRLTPGESPPDPRALMAPWLAPGEQAEIVRAVPYGFHARVAERWRSGRVLLAGDAAHVMPPFAGQGLGMGLRDAGVLAAALVAGEPSGYERARRRHAARTTLGARAWGAVVCARRPRAVVIRDRAAAVAARAPGAAGLLRPR